ncbi:hypothetical protein [Nocardia wallacei]|uniref:hypothetical protein n=1 Tax=Nocardia wallacei TaxID=480035 RepID=UPI00245764D9|nr:hypothetical protein [Nocardia wallacei]
MQGHDIARIAADAARPSYPEISAATNVILTELRDAEVRELDGMVRAVCSAPGVAIAAGEQITVGTGGDAEVRAARVGHYARSVHATRLALARLLAQG